MGDRGAHIYRAPTWDFEKKRGDPSTQDDKVAWAEANPEKWDFYNAVVWPQGYLGEDGKPLPGVTSP